jgi:hypothetical protein
MNESDFNKFVWNDITCHIHSYPSYTHLEPRAWSFGTWRMTRLWLTGEQVGSKPSPIDWWPPWFFSRSGWLWIQFILLNSHLIQLIPFFSRWFTVWLLWGFLTWGYHQIPKSSILEWEFPWNKPSSYWGTSIYGNLHISSITLTISSIIWLTISSII